MLKCRSNEGLRYGLQTYHFVQKNVCFDLKVPLFVEKRKNKFAHEFKKNKFVLIFKLF
jgi:hypothetical protein